MPPRGPQPGDIIGEQYRLELMIGTGGMGAVWSASVEGTADDRVAVKFLHSQMASDPLIVQRFLLEAKAGLDIRHPNVVPVIAQGWLEAGSGVDPSPWLAMELLNGKSLGDTLRLRGRIDAVDALAIVADVTAGVAAAHDIGVVHRDIKPGNVFLQQTDEGVVPKLLDFGISKYVDPGMDGGLTSTGAIVGSAMYMSPEQAAGGYNVDKRSDVWSLGVMLYRMLTGESPLPANGQQEIMVLLGSPKELDLSSLKHPRIPAGAADVVRKCLRKKREERFPSARELEPEIRKILAAEIRDAHTPNIDALLRPASSRATFIAAPLDALPEQTMPTAPTGAGAGAGAGAYTGVVFDDEPSLLEPSIVPVVTQASKPSAPPPSSFDGPPTPRRGATMRMPSSLMTSAPPPPRPATGTPAWAKAAAIAFGIAIVGFGGFAYRYRAATHGTTGTTGAVTPPPPSVATPEPAQTASSEPEYEVVEVPATPGATSSNEPTASKPPRIHIKMKPPPPPPPPKPVPSVVPWRHPGF